jgi:hypothetical protein
LVASAKSGLNNKTVAKPRLLGWAITVKTWSFVNALRQAGFFREAGWY